MTDKDRQIESAWESWKIPTWVDQLQDHFERAA